MPNILRYGNTLGYDRYFAAGVDGAVGRTADYLRTIIPHRPCQALIVAPAQVTLARPKPPQAGESHVPVAPDR